MSSTIALVDDDQHLLTSVTMALEAEGFVVRPHSDPVKALQDMLSRPVDLAVLDIKMPQMDGLELLAQLRRHSTVPVCSSPRRMPRTISSTVSARARTTTSPSPSRSASWSGGSGRSCGGPNLP